MNDDPQAQIFAEFAELARTLGNAHRLMLLEHIAQGERSVERLAALSGLSIANTSQHLQHLKRGGFVQTRRDGKHVLYRLGEGPIVNLLDALRQYAEHNRSAIRDLIADSFHQREQLESISREELLARLEQNSITLLDVRPKEEFVLGHYLAPLIFP